MKCKCPSISHARTYAKEIKRRKKKKGKKVFQRNDIIIATGCRHIQQQQQQPEKKPQGNRRAMIFFFSFVFNSFPIGCIGRDTHGWICLFFFSFCRIVVRVWLRQWARILVVPTFFIPTAPFCCHKRKFYAGSTVARFFRPWCNCDGLITFSFFYKKIFHIQTKKGSDSNFVLLLYNNTQKQREQTNKHTQTQRRRLSAPCL